MQVAAQLALGTGLAVDSCLVALAYGLAARRGRGRTAVAIAVTFGVTQGGLALAGWLAGAPVARLFASLDHWVAFAVLVAIGVKMVADAARESIVPREVSALGIALGAFATSLDAFAAGFGLALAGQRIALIALSAALATALGSAAFFLGARHIGGRWARLAHGLAGLLLIAIGTSIVYQHLG